MTTALLDGDVIAFRAAYVAQRDARAFGAEGDDLEPMIIENALDEARSAIRDWVEGAECSDYVVMFSQSPNFRKTILPTYKSNRKAEDKPIYLAQVIAAIRRGEPCVSMAGLEADDLLGIASGSPTFAGQSVVVSIDKDMLTLPGVHFNPGHRADGIRVVSEREADYRFILQAMTGDAVDGYHGIPKIGSARAAKALGVPGKVGLEGLWNRAATVAASKGMTAADLLQQARVARILRHGDFDRATRTVSLWTPPGHEPATICLRDLK